MAFDHELASRVRQLVDDRAGITETAMFGGLALMLDGKMFCGVLGQELLARVGPDGHAAAMARKHVRLMDFTGRQMRGYVFVGPQALSSRGSLDRWVDECARFVAALPENPPTARKIVVAGRRPVAAPSRSVRKTPPRVRERRR
jgi:hypothetical protein